MRQESARRILLMLKKSLYLASKPAQRGVLRAPVMFPSQRSQLWWGAPQIGPCQPQRGSRWSSRWSRAWPSALRPSGAKHLGLYAAVLARSALPPRDAAGPLPAPFTGPVQRAGGQKLSLFASAFWVLQFSANHGAAPRMPGRDYPPMRRSLNLHHPQRWCSPSLVCGSTGSSQISLPSPYAGRTPAWGMKWATEYCYGA